MAALGERYDALLQAAAKRLRGHQRRLFLAEVTLQLCDGNTRQAERRFGWGRDTVAKPPRDWIMTPRRKGSGRRLACWCWRPGR
jgi:hypothetical protein